jgi:hypothetical protein
MSKLPGFDRHLPAEFSVFSFLFGAEYYQSLEIALPNVGEHYQKVDLFHIEFCNDDAFDDGLCFENQCRYTL